jgi:hypothetical protein
VTALRASLHGSAGRDPTVRIRAPSASVRFAPVSRPGRRNIGDGPRRRLGDVRMQQTRARLSRARSVGFLASLRLVPDGRTHAFLGLIAR